MCIKLVTSLGRVQSSFHCIPYNKWYRTNNNYICHPSVLISYQYILILIISHPASLPPDLYYLSVLLYRLMCYREPDKGFIGGINLDKKFTDRDQSTSTISILADKQTTPPHICVLSEYYQPSPSSLKTRINSLIFS